MDTSDASKPDTSKHCFANRDGWGNIIEWQWVDNYLNSWQKGWPPADAILVQPKRCAVVFTFASGVAGWRWEHEPTHLSRVGVPPDGVEIVKYTSDAPKSSDPNPSDALKSSDPNPSDALKSSDPNPSDAPKQTPDSTFEQSADRLFQLTSEMRVRSQMWNDSLKAVEQQTEQMANAFNAELEASKKELKSAQDAGAKLVEKNTKLSDANAKLGQEKKHLEAEGNSQISKLLNELEAAKKRIADLETLQALNDENCRKHYEELKFKDAQISSLLTTAQEDNLKKDQLRTQVAELEKQTVLDGHSKDNLREQINKLTDRLKISKEHFRIVAEDKIQILLTTAQEDIHEKDQLHKQINTLLADAQKDIRAKDRLREQINTLLADAQKDIREKDRLRMQIVELEKQATEDCHHRQQLIQQLAVREKQLDNLSVSEAYLLGVIGAEEAKNAELVTKLEAADQMKASLAKLLSSGPQ